MITALIWIGLLVSIRVFGRKEDSSYKLDGWRGAVAVTLAVMATIWVNQ